MSADHWVCSLSRSRLFPGRFASKTLLAQQIEGKHVAMACDNAMEFLLHHNFIVATAPERLEECPKERPKESLEESPKEGPKESPKECPKERRKESQKDSTKESPKQSLNGGREGGKEGGEREDYEDYGVAPTQLGRVCRLFIFWCFRFCFWLGGFGCHFFSFLLQKFGAIPSRAILHIQ